MGLQGTIGTTEACSHRAPTADPGGTIPLPTCTSQHGLLHIPCKTLLTAQMKLLFVPAVKKVQYLT